MNFPLGLIKCNFHFFFQSFHDWFGLFLQTDEDEKTLDQRCRQLKAVTERLMKMLETLDNLRFEPDDTESRTARKAAVNRIQV